MSLCAKAMAILVVALACGGSAMSGEELSPKEMENALRLGGVVFGTPEKGRYDLETGDVHTPLREEQLHQYLKSILSDRSIVEKIKQEKPGDSNIGSPDANGVAVPNMERGAGNLLTRTADIAEVHLAKDGDFFKAAVLLFYCRHFLSSDEKVRARALHLIMWYRPRNDSNLEASFGKESRKLVLDFVKTHPDAGRDDIERPNMFANGISLLGMTGGGRDAIVLLKSLKGKLPKFELSRMVALARLGDREAEKQLLDEYEKEANLEKKGYLALALGQASTRSCLERLARDLRVPRKTSTDASYAQVVIGGLCRSRNFPIRGLVGRQGDYTQEEYDAVEAWCEKELHTKWTEPKLKIERRKGMSEASG